MAKDTTKRIKTGSINIPVEDFEDEKATVRDEEDEGTGAGEWGSLNVQDSTLNIEH